LNSGVDSSRSEVVTVSPASDDALLAARDDFGSVVELVRDLVAIPSRGGVDSYQPVVERLAAWLRDRSLPVTVLSEADGALVGLTGEICGAGPGPRWVLDACLDTAPFGDEQAWTCPPASAVVRDGWLWGRGSADSKSGAAIFCHIAARLVGMTGQLHGSLVLLFDVDEHTGGFGGARRYFEGPGAPGDVAGVMIGYPGVDELVIGGRGVHRARLHVHGIASHSGARKATPSAIAKAAQLVRALSAADLPGPAGPGFPLPAKLTVTAIEGGQGYSVTPDLCTLNVDIRTTPAFDDRAAADFLERTVAELDDAWPGTAPTRIQPGTCWPAYVLPEDSLLRSALLNAAEECGVPLETKIAGPSNIGNYLAGLGIAATAGFGVDYVGLHGTDERIRLDTIPAVQAVYHNAVLRLLGGVG
jgi:succinyl-diaminopimelate desuccinylase